MNPPQATIDFSTKLFYGFGAVANGARQTGLTITAVLLQPGIGLELISSRWAY